LAPHLNQPRFAAHFWEGPNLVGAAGSRDEAEAERLERALTEVEREISQLKRITASNRELDLAPQITSLESRAESLREEIARDPTAWQTVQLARDLARPKVMDYVAGLMTEFIELHGDRAFRDDPAIVAGLGMVDGRPAALIGHAKGRDTRENIERNFGSPHPEGYRKAARVMRLAEKLRIPLITLIDTQGAAPGKEAEERGQSEAIASTLLVMARVRTPIVTVITGEGGSGGALAIAIGDVVLMLDKAVYSVISPEGCAAILWRDGSRTRAAARALRLTARDLAGFGVVDEIIVEPAGGAQRHPDLAVAAVAAAVRRHLAALVGQPVEELVAARYDKYRRIGRFDDPGRRPEVPVDEHGGGARSGRTRREEGDASEPRKPVGSRGNPGVDPAGDGGGHHGARRRRSPRQGSDQEGGADHGRSVFGHGPG
jgi:acetyl-CoA carboxylase carboxyl transferase subunit alpha